MMTISPNSQSQSRLLVVFHLEHDAEIRVIITEIDVLVAVDFVRLSVSGLYFFQRGADLDAGRRLDAIVTGNLDVACQAVYECHFEGIAVFVFRDRTAKEFVMMLCLDFSRRAVHLLA